MKKLILNIDLLNNKAGTIFKYDVVYDWYYITSDTDMHVELGVMGRSLEFLVNAGIIRELMTEGEN